MAAKLERKSATKKTKRARAPMQVAKKRAGGAPGTAAGGRQQHRQAEGTRRQLASLVEFLSGLENVPAPVRKMLSTAAWHCFETDQEDRCELETQFIAMLAEVTTNAETQAQAAVHEAEAQVAGMDAERASREASLEQAINKLEAAKVAVAEHRAAIAVVEAAEADGRRMLDELRRNHKSSETEVAAAKKASEQAQKHLESFRRDVITTFKQLSDRSAPPPVVTDENVVAESAPVQPDHGDAVEHPSL